MCPPGHSGRPVEEGWSLGKSVFGRDLLAKNGWERKQDSPNQIKQIQFLFNVTIARLPKLADL